MLQKIKKMMKGICSSERIKMLSLMLLVGTVTAFAQNAAGDYSAGTPALGNQCVYKNEQRGTGCQEVHHDDCGRLYLPCGRGTGTSVVLWYLRLTAHGNRNGQQPLHGISTVQGASTAS